MIDINGVKDLKNVSFLLRSDITDTNYTSGETFISKLDSNSEINKEIEKYLTSDDNQMKYLYRIIFDGILNNKIVRYIKNDKKKLQRLYNYEKISLEDFKKGIKEIKLALIP